MTDAWTDAAYDEIAAAYRAGCCDKRRKPCVEHITFLDGVERGLSYGAAEVERLRAKVEEWQARSERAHNVALCLSEWLDHADPSRDPGAWLGLAIADVDDSLCADLAAALSGPTTKETP